MQHSWKSPHIPALIQELSGVLKQFEKRLRAVEKAQMANDTESFLLSVTESIKLHTAVATLCEETAGMQATYLPKLLREHADGVIARATMQQVTDSYCWRLTLHAGLICKSMVQEDLEAMHSKCLCQVPFVLTTGLYVFLAKLHRPCLANSSSWITYLKIPFVELG